jgi:hypothetical protein
MLSRTFGSYQRIQRRVRGWSGRLKQLVAGGSRAPPSNRDNAGKQGQFAGVAPVVRA